MGQLLRRVLPYITSFGMGDITPLILFVRPAALLNKMLLCLIFFVLCGKL